MKAYLLHAKGVPFESIAPKVKNLKGELPGWTTVRDIVNSFDENKGCRKYNYHKCGRKPWKMTSDVQKYVLRQLKAMRAKEIVTSVTLRADLAKNRGVEVSDASIRKFLKKAGYQWLPRCQKKKYSVQQRDERMKFAAQVLRLSAAQLRAKLDLSLDGVVLSMPPADATERFNYCWGGESHMWRKRDEANLPALAGRDEYKRQVPVERAIPLWGGLSHGWKAHRRD